jgi:hypothetical protein
MLLRYIHLRAGRGKYKQIYHQFNYFVGSHGRFMMHKSTETRELILLEMPAIDLHNRRHFLKICVAFLIKTRHRIWMTLQRV